MYFSVHVFESVETFTSQLFGLVVSNPNASTDDGQKVSFKQIFTDMNVVIAIAFTVIDLTFCTILEPILEPELRNKVRGNLSS